MNKLIIFVFAISLAAPASSEGWRVRARERFQSGHYNAGDGNGQFAFRGLTTAFLLGYEKPLDWSVGLALQRGGLKRNGSQEKANATTIGLEGKAYLSKELPFYLRAGILAEAFDRVGSDPARWAPGIAINTGYEFLIKKVGIAPEIGTRLFWGPSNRRHISVTAGLGIHFYRIGDL
ncbi:MAG: hypothetical protein COB53_03870 [Elusimicrobia bacterium]|nr:MAG: hypothetical protein COB53_03870 [Elusimicrobiota bacterium]